MTAQLELAPAPPAWSRPARRGAPLLAVRIPIEPHPKERTGGNGRVRFTPPAYRDWLDRFCQSMHEYSPAQDREPISVPVLFEVTLVYPRPAKLPAFVNVKGVRVPVDQHDGRVHYLRAADYDNAIGAVFDGLVRARFLLDDRLCVQPAGSGGKWWAAKGEDTCCEVRLWAARDDVRLHAAPVAPEPRLL